MKINSRSTLNLAALLAILVPLMASAVFVSPAYAAAYVVNTQVDNTTDDAFCTLREAINAANNTAGSNTNCGALSSADDTITFNIFGLFLLGSTLPNIVSGQGALTIDGAGFVTLSGNSAVRVMSVAAGADLTLQDITIANGRLTNDHGAGLYNLGSLIIIDSTFSGNVVTGSGEAGGILNTGAGTMTITGSTFTGNNSSVAGGGLSNYGGLVTIEDTTFTLNSAPIGGGIFNNSMIEITNSTITDNDATSRGAGLANYVTATIDDSTFTFNNAAGGAGGAIYNLAGATLEITDSTLTNNSATPTLIATGGGAIFNGVGATLTVDNTIISDNDLTAGSAQNSGGAAISNFVGTVTITNSTISNNTLVGTINTGGGAISNYGTLSIDNSTLSGNSVTGNVGGGIFTSFSGSLTVTNSTFSDNSTNASGGGIYGSTITIANSTFSNNSAASIGGGGYIGNFTVANSTFSDNSATTGGGLATTLGGTVYNTIVANSTTGGNCSGSGAFNVASTNNLSTDATCGASFNQVTSAELNLGALTGDPQYFPLESGSAAIDAGDDTQCAASPVDNESQNGVTRPVDGDGDGTATCDIGSYEKPVAPAPTPAPESEDGEGDGGNRGSKEIAESGTTIFYFQRAYVSVPAEAIPPGETNCKIVVANKGESGEYGFELNDVVYDVKIVCDGKSITVLYAHITVCIRPKDGITSDKQLFHKHTGASSFAPISGGTGPSGYVCGSTQTLSLFTLGEFFLPDTGFAPGVVTQLDEQPAAAEYFEYDQLMLEIPVLGVMTPIWGVPQSQNGWDVSWLGEAAGYLYGTAFPTWVGNSVLTAHVWNADNSAGPFYHLKDLGYGDQFYIHAYGQTYVYEVRGNRLVSEQNLSVMKDSDYSLITLITCESFSESSGEYLYRRAVQAVLVDVRQ